MAATVVMVHGAFMGAWVWEPVIDGLAAEGVRAIAVDLDLQTLIGDTEIVSRAVAEARGEGKSVVLAGHSYGGMVISNAGHQADELVYVCALLPPPGGSMAEILSSAELSDAAANMLVAHDNGTVSVDPDRAVEAFYHRCPPAMASEAVDQLRQFALACMTTPVADPAWVQVPASYVVCTDDQAIPSTLQREFAAQVGHAFELDADHSPFYSATQQLVAVLSERAHAR